MNPEVKALQLTVSELLQGLVAARAQLFDLQANYEKLAASQAPAPVPMEAPKVVLEAAPPALEVPISDGVFEGAVDTPPILR